MVGGYRVSNEIKDDMQQAIRLLAKVETLSEIKEDSSLYINKIRKIINKYTGVNHG